MLGHGRNSMVKVSVDIFCRMDLDELSRGLENCLKNKIPVVGVVAVFGTTQEGAVDNLDLLLNIREDFEKRGLTFYIHVDGAWGGYFASCIVKKNGTRTKSSRKMSGIEKKVTLARAHTVTFLESNVSTHFRNQLSCLEEANSITLDPHKSGFCPYPAGGLLYRNGNIRNFLAQRAAYVSHGTGKNEEINLFGIDGSKPGTKHNYSHFQIFVVFKVLQVLECGCLTKSLVLITRVMDCCSGRVIFLVSIIIFYSHK